MKWVKASDRAIESGGFRISEVSVYGKRRYSLWRLKNSGWYFVESFNTPADAKQHAEKLK